MISISFSNMEEIRRVYDPSIVDRATRDATRRLRDKVATQVSKAVRDVYSIKAGDISRSLRKRARTRVGHEGLLVYTSKRLSLSYFATNNGQPNAGNRPKVKTPRGVRRGAKVKVVKSKGRTIIDGAFWGRGRAGIIDGAGAWQIFVRKGSKRNPIKKLTGPSVSQLVGSRTALEAVNQVVGRDADKILAQRIDFYTGRKAGVL